MPPMRPVHWVGSSRDDLRAMPEEVQREFGRALLVAQLGGRSRIATPLQGFGGASVLELRDDYESDTYRCVYTVRFARAVYVLHAFQKKSRHGIRMTRHDVALIRTRLAEAMGDYDKTYEKEG